MSRPLGGRGKKKTIFRQKKKGHRGLGSNPAKGRRCTLGLGKEGGKKEGRQRLLRRPQGRKEKARSSPATGFFGREKKKGTCWRPAPTRRRKKKKIEKRRGREEKEVS